jgi:hypothetical protein
MRLGYIKIGQSGHDKSSSNNKKKPKKKKTLANLLKKTVKCFNRKIGLCDTCKCMVCPHAFNEQLYRKIYSPNIPSFTKYQTPLTETLSYPYKFQHDLNHSDVFSEALGA